MRFARRERGADREAFRIRAEMDLCREPTARTAKSVFLNPPFRRRWRNASISTNIPLGPLDGGRSIMDDNHSLNRLAKDPPVVQIRYRIY
jgi:hypothetical protein